ncbi:hypothetical protein JOD55_001041 [Arcanobacterium pluranimalium]|nr:hypothetical protein [Arcanobacterium pluranimalium]
MSAGMLGSCWGLVGVLPPARSGAPPKTPLFLSKNDLPTAAFAHLVPKSKIRISTFDARNTLITRKIRFHGRSKDYHALANTSTGAYTART